MTRVSRIPLNTKKIEALLDDFWCAVALIESKSEAKNFFFDLLTHTERKMLAKRLQVALMLLDGEDYKTIRSSLKVSDNTIAKINNWLNTGADGLTKITKRLLDIKEKKLGKTGEMKKRSMSGDLATPAVKLGLDVTARQLKRWRKRKSVLT